MIQCKSEVNEAWLSPAGVFSTVASVASASFCPTSSKRGRHIEAYFRCSDCFHLSKGNRHKKADVFLFPILIFISNLRPKHPISCQQNANMSENLVSHLNTVRMTIPMLKIGVCWHECRWEMFPPALVSHSKCFHSGLILVARESKNAGVTLGFFYFTNSHLLKCSFCLWK